MSCSQIFQEKALQKQRQHQQHHIKHYLWKSERITEEFINIFLTLKNEEIENEKIENEENVMNHSFVSADSQPSSADVMTHSITIYNDDDDDDDDVI